MKVGVIFVEDVKQIILTPENAREEYALSLISGDDNISLAVKRGSLYDKDGAVGMELSLCAGGYLRAFSNSKSIMLVLSPKAKTSDLCATGCYPNPAL